MFIFATYSRQQIDVQIDHQIITFPLGVLGYNVVDEPA